MILISRSTQTVLKSKPILGKGHRLCPQLLRIPYIPFHPLIFCKHFQSSYALDFLDRQTLYGGDSAFLMVIAPPAPHQPFTPEPKYKGVFRQKAVPREPHFNRANNSVSVEDNLKTHRLKKKGFAIRNQDFLLYCFHERCPSSSNYAIAEIIPTYSNVNLSN